jgi:hypothetical protein
MMLIHFLAWPAALALGWAMVYLIWIKPLRAKLVAIVPLIVEPELTPVVEVVDGRAVASIAPPTAWQKFVAAVEGWKTIGLSAVLSVFASASAVFDAVQGTGMVEDFQNLPWASFLKPDVALKIISAMLVIVPIFHLVGKVKAAMATPVTTGAEKAD